MKYNGAGNLIGDDDGERVTVGLRVGEGDAVGVGGNRVIVGSGVNDGSTVGDAMTGIVRGACVGNGDAVGRLPLDALQANPPSANTSNTTRR